MGTQTTVPCAQAEDSGLLGQLQSPKWVKVCLVSKVADQCCYPTQSQVGTPTLGQPVLVTDAVPPGVWQGSNKRTSFEVTGRLHPGQLAVMPDLPHSRQLAVMPDLPHPGQLAVMPDLTQSGQLAVMPDLTQSGQLAVMPDLTQSGQLAVMPDLTQSGQLAVMPDLTLNSGQLRVMPDLTHSTQDSWQ